MECVELVGWLWLVVCAGMFAALLGSLPAHRNGCDRDWPWPGE